MDSGNPPATPQPRRESIALALRAAIASVLAVGAAQLLHLAYPIYALIAAVLVSDASFVATRRLGLHRLLGTALGAVAGAVLSSLFGHALWALGLGVLVVLEHSVQPWAYALDRFFETTLGIASALLVGFVFSLLAGHTDCEPRP